MPDNCRGTQGTWSENSNTPEDSVIWREARDTRDRSPGNILELAG